MSRNLAYFLAAALPAVLLLIVSYAGADPHRFPGVAELIFERYEGAAQASPRSAMLWRAALMPAVFLLPFAMLTRLGGSASRFAISGAGFSMVLGMPSVIAWVMGGTWLAACIQGGLVLAATGLLIGVLRRLPHTAVPAAVVCAILSVATAINASFIITLRSNPELFVIDRAARQPDSVEAQLALAMHLAFVGSVEEASPELRQAATLLLGDQELMRDKQLRDAATRLFEMTGEPQTSDSPGLPRQAGESVQP